MPHLRTKAPLDVDRLSTDGTEGRELLAEANATMSSWAWVGVGLGAFFLIAVLFSLAVAAILGRVSREASELFAASP